MKMEQRVPKRRHINSDAAELPRRMDTTFRMRRNFEMKNKQNMFIIGEFSVTCQRRF